jgi:hypothetical protein
MRAKAMDFAVRVLGDGNEDICRLLRKRNEVSPKAT